MKRVILESPFAGNSQRNIAYGRKAVRDSLCRGEAPIASHLLYTQDGILNDDNAKDRLLGINAGLSWCDVSEGTVVYADWGITKGMEYGIARAKEAGKIVDIRYLYGRKK